MKQSSGDLLRQRAEVMTLHIVTLLFAVSPDTICFPFVAMTGLTRVRLTAGCLKSCAVVLIFCCLLVERIMIETLDVLLRW